MSPSDSGRDIHLSVTNDDTDEEAKPAPRKPRQLPKFLFGHTRRVVIASAIALVMVIGVPAGLYTYDWSATDDSESEPVQAMETFLQAVQDGDIDTAREFMLGDVAEEEFQEESDPDDAALDPVEDSLDPTRYSSDWTVGDIGLTEENLGQAEVSVEIIAADGTSSTHEAVMFDNEDKGWVLANAHSQLVTSIGYVHPLMVNGELPETEAESAPFMALVLPGVYTYDDPGLDFVQLKYNTIMTLAGDSTYANMNSEDGSEATEVGEDAGRDDLFELREDAQEAAQIRIDRYLDNCVANSLENVGCPVSVSPDDLNSTVDGELSFDESSAQWEIVELPEVDVSYEPRGFVTQVLSFDNVTPGIAELTVTADGESDMTFQCDIGIDSLEAGLDVDGEFFIEPLEHPEDSPHIDEDVANMDCDLAS